MGEAAIVLAVHALEAALRGAPLFLVAILLARQLRGRPAALRHALWCAALVGQAALFLSPAIIREVPVPGLPGWTSPVRQLDEPPTVRALSSASFVPSSPTAHPRSADRLPASPFRAWSLGPLAWWAGMGIALFMLCLARIRRLAWRRGASPASPALAALTRTAASASGVGRRVRVLTSSGCCTPATWGVFRPVILLPAGADAWPRERLRAVLLHELSHVRRLDALSRGLCETLSVVLWFDPLVWSAGQAMRNAAECACDDAVVTAGLRPSRYVGHLVEIARGTVSPPPAAINAMVRGGSLERRALAILDPGARRTRPSPTAALAAGALTAVLALPLGALVPGTGGIPTGGEAVCTYTGGRHLDVLRAGTWLVEWEGDGCSVEVRAEGEVTFAGDLSGVTDVGDGGSLSIEVTQPSGTRSFRVTSTDRAWHVDGTAAEFDAQSEAWLGAFLVELDRHTGFAVDARLPMILAAGGPKLVIAEAARTEGGHAGGVYLGRLIKTESLDAAQVARVLAVAASVVHVDAVMSDLLSAVRARHDIAVEPVAGAYAAAAATLQARAATEEASSR